MRIHDVFLSYLGTGVEVRVGWSTLSISLISPLGHGAELTSIVLYFGLSVVNEMK